MIIAFGHQRRRGKDTAAKFLEVALRIRHPRLIVQRKGFADALKEVAHSMFKWGGLEPGIYYENHPEVKETVLPKIGKSPRDIWIELGNKCREIHQDVWVQRVLSTDDPGRVLIISDLRYPNEFTQIRAVGGKCVKIVRPGLAIPTDVADTALNECESWDYVVQNNGSLEIFQMNITDLSEQLIPGSQGVARP